MIGSAAVALLLWYGSGEVLANALTFGGLVAFIEYTSRFFLPIRDLGAKYSVMQAAMVSAERVFGLLDTAPAFTGGRRAAGPPAAADVAVEFRGVSFAYPGGDWVLRECSFRIGARERVALVGPTGEGKTTIARLMMRAYEVAEGQVLVGGIDVRDWDMQALRRYVGLIPAGAVSLRGQRSRQPRARRRRRRRRRRSLPRARAGAGRAPRRRPAGRARGGGAGAWREPLPGPASAAGHRARPHL